MNTFLAVKPPSSTEAVNLSFADLLTPLETITTVSVSNLQPAGSLVVTVVPGPYTNLAKLSVSAGNNNVSYSVLVKVLTSTGQTLEKLLAVVINSEIPFEYNTQNLSAVSALVDTIQAGESAIGEHTFILPNTLSAVSGSVSWELLDNQGTLLSSGPCFEYNVSTTSTSLLISCKGIVNVPSNVSPTLLGQSYQLRYTLIGVTETPIYAFENITVAGFNTVPIGVEDTIELTGNTAILNLVLPKAFDTVSVAIYDNNNKILSAVSNYSNVTSDGWMYTVEIPDVDITPKLESYTVLWSAKNSSKASYVETHTGRLFITTPSILSAVEDIRIYVNKSRTTINGKPDLLFSAPLLIAYLRRGRDAFNAAFGMFTNFDMTNAQGGIREYWLKYAEVYALRSQFLAEGEKAFNFTGQAISLEVDKTQFYQSAADSIQQDLDNNGKTFKQNLIKKGITGGDGNPGNLSLMRPGANGTVGISISPATSWGRYAGRLGLR
jgi:hypothetical protein